MKKVVLSVTKVNKDEKLKGVDYLVEGIFLFQQRQAKVILTYNQFAKTAEKYLALERNKNDAFVVVIARSPKELIHEGNVLHRCVEKRITSKSSFEKKV